MLQIFSLLGLHCEENIDDCAIDSCQHGGKCKDGNNTFTCTCSKGYDGTRCEKHVLCEASEELCKNSGKCTNIDDHYKCDCTGDWTGLNCEIPT